MGHTSRDKQVLFLWELINSCIHVSSRCDTNVYLWHMEPDIKSDTNEIAKHWVREVCGFGGVDIIGQLSHDLIKRGRSLEAPSPKH